GGCRRRLSDERGVRRVGAAGEDDLAAVIAKAYSKNRVRIVHLGSARSVGRELEFDCQRRLTGVQAPAASSPVAPGTAIASPSTGTWPLRWSRSGAHGRRRGRPN